MSTKYDFSVNVLGSIPDYSSMMDFICEYILMIDARTQGKHATTNKAEWLKAVLVCDGFRLEMAETVYRHSKLNRWNDYAFAMLPSVTENGMSALLAHNSGSVTPSP